MFTNIPHLVEHSQAHQQRHATFAGRDFGASSKNTLPAYSLTPHQKEITLEGGQSSFRGSSWTYRTKHMTIELDKTSGSQTKPPMYGLNNKIEGLVKLPDNRLEDITDVSVVLEGNLVTSVLTSGSGIAKSNTLFLSHSVSLPLSRRPSHEQLDKRFGIPIPPEVTIQGFKHLTPPSYYRLDVGMTSEIVYSLKISIIRRGVFRNPFRLEDDDTKIIPIVYFPKTRPVYPPLADIPKPPSGREIHVAAPNVLIAEHVDTFPLMPRWSSSSSSSSSRAKKSSIGLEPFKKSIFFSLPAPQSFASGEKIPFFLSIVFSHNPVQAAMYANLQNIKVVLRKQLSVRPVVPRSNLRRLFTRRSNSKSSPRASELDSPTTSPDISDSEEDRASSRSSSSTSSSSGTSTDSDMYGPAITRRWLLSTGHLETLSEYSEGVYLLRGWISSDEHLDHGEFGSEGSWQIGDIAHLQYFLEVEIDSPTSMEGHLPAFRLEKEIEITTDVWEDAVDVMDDSRDPHIQPLSGGGVDSPAWGLARSFLGQGI